MHDIFCRTGQHTPIARKLDAYTHSEYLTGLAAAVPRLPGAGLDKNMLCFSAI